MERPRRPAEEPPAESNKPAAVRRVGRRTPGPPRGQPPSLTVQSRKPPPPAGPPPPHAIRELTSPKGVAPKSGQTDVSAASNDLDIDVQMTQTIVGRAVPDLSTPRSMASSEDKLNASQEQSPPPKVRRIVDEQPPPPKERQNIDHEQLLPPKERRRVDDQPPSKGRRIDHKQPSPPKEQRIVDEQPSPPKEQWIVDEQPSPPKEERIVDERPSPPKDRRIVSVQPQREARIAVPYRPPPDAPPGKSPPHGAPPKSAKRNFGELGRPPSSTGPLAKSVSKGPKPPSRPAPRHAVIAVRPAPPPHEPPHEDDDDDDDDEAPPPPDVSEEQGPNIIPPPPTEPPPKKGIDGAPPPPSERAPKIGVPSPPKATVSGHLPESKATLPDHELVPGRLSVTCIEGLNVQRHGKAAERTKIDAYLRLTLGKHSNVQRKRTHVKKHSTSHIFFDSEILTFDIVEPRQLAAEGNLPLLIELFDENAWSDDLIASTETSVERLMANGHLRVVQTLPLRVHNPNDTSGSQSDAATSSGLKLELLFEPARIGMVLFTLYEGRHLKNMNAVGKQDPYVQFALGDKLVRSSTKVDGGADPSFGEEQIPLWVGKGEWTDDLVVRVYDEDVGTDDLIGQCSLSLLHCMSMEHAKSTERVYELFAGVHDTTDSNIANKGPRAGELLMKVEFLPAGVLKINCISAKNLRGDGNQTDVGFRQDPYLVVSVSGSCSKETKRTHVDQDGGKQPVWNETLTLHVVDQHQLKIECYDHDVVETDDAIGDAIFSLLPVFKNGLADEWITIYKAPEYGPLQEAGDIHLLFQFDGPKGVKYPQHSPGIASFDETDRVNNIREELKKLDTQKIQQQQAEHVANSSKAIESSSETVELADRVIERARKPPRGRTDEFTDEEIEAAFKFIDLDKNNYVGAAEIRHVLICMGELITDEEVDTMIKMIDADGDGQISFREFYRIVTDPDPARTDFLQCGEVDHLDGMQQGQALNAKAHERQKELKIRSKKREMLSQFVEENGIAKAEVRLAYQRYMHLPNHRKQGTRVDFETYCEVLGVEQTGETHLMFALFDRNSENTVDMKEIILGMCNWVDMTHEERVNIVFDLYDEDRSGFLSIGELAGILMANHMQSAASVQKKVETIIKQADRNGDGTLSRAEFDVVSKKFPTILFPKFKRDQNSEQGVSFESRSSPPSAVPSTESSSRESPWREQRKLVPAA